MWKAQELLERNRSRRFASSGVSGSLFYWYAIVVLYVKLQNDATRVAGFRMWLSLIRNVTKGSKAIKILASYKKKVTDKDPITNEEKKNELLCLSV